MKTFLSSRPYNLDLGLLLIRLMFGVSMAAAGYSKLVHFNEMAQDDFWNTQVNFLGLTGGPVLALVVFAEFFCSLLLIVGLFTRLALIPLLICTFYIFALIDGAVYKVDANGLTFAAAFPYFVVYLALFATGAGRYSVDYLIGKKGR